MKTKLIAIGNIIVIIFFISRIRIKMHLKFFLMKITMQSAYAKLRLHKIFLWWTPFPVGIIKNIKFINWCIFINLENINTYRYHSKKFSIWPLDGAHVQLRIRTWAWDYAKCNKSFFVDNRCWYNWKKSDQ